MHNSNLTIKDYLESILLTLKALEKNYTVSLTEASNESVFELYNDMFNNCKMHQRAIYNYMLSKGFYKIENAEEIKINETLNKLTSQFNSLSLNDQ